MKKKTLLIILIVIAAIGVLVGVIFGIHYLLVRILSAKYNLTELTEGELPPKQEAVEDDYIQLSEVNMHYVRYGNGEQTVLLIHGNGGSTNSLKELAQYLANDYTVYCLDSRCQGLSSDPGVISYDAMAEDVYEFITAKSLEKPYLLGHSDGGIIGIILAANHPDALGACISCGANSEPSTLKSYYIRDVKSREKNKLYDLMLEEPHLTTELMAKIDTPFYIVAGEYDLMPLSDTVFLHESISNSRIAIIKNHYHSTYISRNGKLIYHLAYDYFKEMDQLRSAQ